jgi:hypothetical protein
MVHNILLPIRRRLLVASIAAGVVVGGVLVAPLSAQAAASVSNTDPNASFVQAAYADVLGRTASSSEISGWTAMLASGTPRDAVASGFNNSDEYRLHMIDSAYQDVLKRSSDAGGRIAWLNGMRSGTLQPDDVHRIFLSTDEFYQKVGGGTDAGFITAVYRDVVGRAPLSNEVAYWTPILSRIGRQGTVDSFWFAAETINRQAGDLFTNFLGRSANPGDVTNWANIVRANGLTSARNMIMSSGEYAARAVARFPSSPVADPAASPSGGFPTRSSAGLPAGWVPVTRVTGDYHVRTAGAVVQDLQITNGTLYVEAPNVTLNRIQGIGAYVDNGPGSTCFNGLLVENSTFTPNGVTRDTDDPVIQYGGYTAKNIVIDGAPEGLRVGGSSMGCGPVTVQDSFIRVASPTVCTDWHGDGIQGYGGNTVTVRNTTILMAISNGCGGTAPFFYPKNQGNTSVDIDGLLLGGDAGYPFRDGMPGTVKNLNVIAGSWDYAPVDVNCSAISNWQAQTVTLNPAGQPIPTGTTIPCTGTGN